jgi:hypothetical protein
VVQLRVVALSDSRECLAAAGRLATLGGAVAGVPARPEAAGAARPSTSSVCEGVGSVQ